MSQASQFVQVGGKVRRLAIARYSVRNPCLIERTPLPTHPGADQDRNLCLMSRSFGISFHRLPSRAPRSKRDRMILMGERQPETP
jgi:hypothetical protein